MLIVCEGRVTEIEYFQGIRDHFRSLSVEIHDCRVIGLGRDPASVVGHAIQERDKKKREARTQHDSNIAYDEVWCVVNVDDHMTLGQALVDARRGKVNLVVSFPCFELWVLYHFQDYPVSTNRIEIRRKLKRHLPEYDKHLGLDFPFERYATAQQRAEKADPDHCEPNRRGSNPSTNVWLVVETIRQAGRPV